MSEPKYYTINGNGCSIRCKLYRNENEKIQSVVLFGHGFGGHKDNRAAERFARHTLRKNKNIAVMTFDWPCHGEDARKALHLSDCHHYLAQILLDLESRFDSPAIYSYATSFGGYLVLKYISEAGNPFERVALRCPAVNMYDVITKAIMTEENRHQMEKAGTALVGFDRKIKIQKEFLDSLMQEDISVRDYRNYSEDLLILHGTLDEVVPFDTVRYFAEQNHITFIPVTDADHRFQDPAKMDLSISYITDFFGLH